MKVFKAFTTLVAFGAGVLTLNAQQSNAKLPPNNRLYLDVHHLGAGNVNAKAAAEAHRKDLAVEGGHGVSFLKYWVDEAQGDIYCLASAADSSEIRKTHAEAHGLVPDQINEVIGGKAGPDKGKHDYYLDLHEFGPGGVNATAVVGAHEKDLAIQKKFGVTFINYFVDEKKGTVMCLATAPDSSALMDTHKNAHGLMPVKVIKVKQGQ